MPKWQPTQTELDIIQQMAGEYSYIEISKAVGCSHTTLFYYMKRQGLSGIKDYGQARQVFQQQLDKLKHEKHGIYYIVNRTKNKSYIGYSCNVHRRLREHLTKLHLNKHKNSSLQSDWNDDEFEIGLLLRGELPHLEMLIVNMQQNCYNVNRCSPAYNKLTPQHIQRFHNSYTKHQNGCWIWKWQRDKDGYGIFTSTARKNRFYLPAHRVSYYIHHGVIPPGMLIRHLCGNSLCVNPDHLTIGTDEQNASDGAGNGKRWGRPPKIDRKKLQELLQSDMSKTDIAKQFGVTPSSITHAIKKWSLES